MVDKDRSPAGRGGKRADLAEQPEANRRGGRRAALNPELQSHIGRQLQTIYDEVVKEEVPERFLDLLRQLEASGKPPSKE